MTQKRISMNKSFDVKKLDSPLPIEQIDKGHIQRIPLEKAYGNAKAIVASRLPTRPLPSGNVGGE